MCWFFSLLKISLEKNLSPSYHKTYNLEQMFTLPFPFPSLFIRSIPSMENFYFLSLYPVLSHLLLFLCSFPMSFIKFIHIKTLHPKIIESLQVSVNLKDKDETKSSLLMSPDFSQYCNIPLTLKKKPNCLHALSTCFTSN